MRLQHDKEHNALRLTLDNEGGIPATRTTVAGLVDVAANGRLVGVELRTDVSAAGLATMFERWTSDPVAGEFVELNTDGTVYIELTTGDAGEEALSTTVELAMEFDEGNALLAVSIPRRGAGYEISYPSGNR